MFRSGSLQISPMRHVEQSEPLIEPHAAPKESESQDESMVAYDETQRSQPSSQSFDSSQLSSGNHAFSYLQTQAPYQSQSLSLI
jgi:hypothetical protein